MGSMLSAVPPVRPEARPSDDVLVPFVCGNCDAEYADYPALVVVETSEGRIRFCTDACAEEGGYTEAVVRRYALETEAPHRSPSSSSRKANRGLVTDDPGRALGALAVSP